MSMYDGRIVTVDEGTDDVTKVAAFWDGDEYHSEGEVIAVACDDNVSLYLAHLTGDSAPGVNVAALLQFWPEGDNPGFVGGLMLDLYAVERLIKVLPEVRDRLQAAKS